MKWFEGSINEAVAAAKTRKAIFVVFVEGKDDASVQVATSLNNDEVSSRLEKENFVAVKLESGSEPYRFFAQIYQLVPVPSLFFIGENGAPLEIVAGNATPEDLKGKIDTILAKVGLGAKNSSADLINSERKVSVPEKTEIRSVPLDDESSRQNAEKKKDETVQIATDKESAAAVDSTVKPSGSLDGIVDSGNSTVVDKEKQETEVSPEEKIERARQLIELKKRQREEEEKKREREREIERRKMGQDMQKMKQKQQELEIKQAYDERMREKAAEAAAREKVRQQIAQDRLERKQRELAQQQQNAQKQAPAEQSKPQASVVSDAKIARIQFRMPVPMPAGFPHTGQFDPASTLGELRNYVQNNIELPFRQYVMCTSFPRRELTTDEDSKTLLELELVPTAVILILPSKNSTSSSSVTSSQDLGFLSRFIWNFFAPLVSVYNYLVGYFHGPPRRNTTERHGNVSGGAAAPSTANNSGRPISPLVRASTLPSGVVRRNPGDATSATVRSEGNIHRLHSGGDQDDENNTWNGNSTQQM